MTENIVDDFWPITPDISDNLLDLRFSCCNMEHRGTVTLARKWLDANVSCCLTEANSYMLFCPRLINQEVVK